MGRPERVASATWASVANPSRTATSPTRSPGAVGVGAPDLAVLERDGALGAAGRRR